MSSKDSESPNVESQRPNEESQRLSKAGSLGGLLVLRNHTVVCFRNASGADDLVSIVNQMLFGFFHPIHIIFY